MRMRSSLFSAVRAVSPLAVLVASIAVSLAGCNDSSTGPAAGSQAENVQAQQDANKSMEDFMKSNPEGNQPSEANSYEKQMENQMQ